MTKMHRAKTIETRQTERGLQTTGRHSRVDFEQLLGLVQLNMFDCKQGPVER